jgi:hypothetical protein
MYELDVLMKLKKPKDDAYQAFTIACALYNAGVVVDPAARDAAKDAYEAALQAHDAAGAAYREKCYSQNRYPTDEYKMPTSAMLKERIAAEKAALDAALDAARATPRQRRRARSALDRIALSTANANAGAMAQGCAISGFNS